MKTIAVFISEYSIGNNPSIINLLDLLADKYKVDLYLKSVSLKKSSILKKKNLKVISLDKSRLSKFFDNLKLNLKTKKYHKYLSIDPHGFYLCKKLFPESNPIYYSLELYMSYDYFGLLYPKYVMDRERKEINSIKGLMIQSEEKEKLFRSDYGLDEKIPSLILPVTYKGASIPEKSAFLREKYNIDKNKKIALHLGGIAEWFSCIEIALIFSKLPDWVLFFQGYPDQVYVEKFKKILADQNVTNVIISEENYSEIDDVNKILMSCDLGIAWYNDISIGFRTAGKSSGKISSYLKFGLPVIAKKYNSTFDAIQNTNSGICVDNFDEIPDAVDKIEKDYNIYSQNALLEYDKNYRFENYEEKILEFIEFETMQNSLAHQSYWDKGYENYNFQPVLKDDMLIKWLKKYLSSGKGKYVEIGCFPGRYLTFFGKLGYQLNGIDLTPKVEKDLPDWLKESGYEVGKFVKADFLTYNFVEKFDIVSSFGFIEHFHNWQDVLKKHAELVKEGGYIVVTAPNFYGLLQRLLHITLDKENYNRHNINSMRPDLWAEILKKEGFEIINQSYFGKFDFWVDIQKRNLLQKIILGCILSSIRTFRKLLPENKKLYSPYCGVIARKISSVRSCLVKVESPCQASRLQL